MNFVQAIESCYKNYFNFSGRARRSEYWYFVLWTLILTIAVFIFLGVMLLYVKTNILLALVSVGLELITALVLLGSLVPLWSAQVRRLHDMGRSGWWAGASILLAIFNEIGALTSLHKTVSAADLGGLLWRFAFDVAGLILAFVILFFLVQPSREENNRFAGYR